MLPTIYFVGAGWQFFWGGRVVAGRVGPGGNGWRARWGSRRGKARWGGTGRVGRRVGDSANMGNVYTTRKGPDGPQTGVW